MASSEIRIELTNASREELLAAISLLGKSVETLKADRKRLQDRLELKETYIRKRSYAVLSEAYNDRTYDELLDTVGQLHNSLLEANATISRAQDTLSEISEHGPVWGILDDYDGSMDNLKAITDPLEAQINALKDQINDMTQRELNRPNYQKIVVDLCRCSHGRVQGDNCNSCAGGVSPSREGIALGYGLSAQKRLVIPSRDNMHNIEEWYK